MKTALALLLLSSSVFGDVVASYNFDGRVHAAAAVRRDNVDGPLLGLTSGPDYVPRAKAGELGPVLSNPFGGAHASYYRSFYDDAYNREALVLAKHHAFSCDSYVAAADALPTTGPLTVELLFRLDSATPGAMILDLGGETLEAADYTEIQPVWTLRCRSGKDTLEAKGLEAGRYYHLALVDDGTGQLKLYVDGELAASAKLTKPTERGPKFGIARRSDGQGDPGFLTGAFDAIAVHTSPELMLKLK